MAWDSELRDSISPGSACRAALVLAVLAASATIPIARAETEPERIVQTATSRVLTLIDQNLKRYRERPADFYKAVEITVAPHFDFVRMSKLVLGNNVWREASPAVQNDFIFQFRTMLVRTYGSMLLHYRGHTVSRPEVLEKFDSRGQPVSDPSAPESDLRVVRVRTKIENSAATQGYYLLDYDFLRSPQGWGVVDLMIDGASLVTTYSVTFKAIIEKRGMEGLNIELRQLNDAAGKAGRP